MYPAVNGQRGNLQGTHLFLPRVFLCLTPRFLPLPRVVVGRSNFYSFLYFVYVYRTGIPQNEQRWLHRHAPRRRRRPKASPRPGEGSAAKVSFATSRDVKGGGWVGRGVGIHSAPGRRGGRRGFLGVLSDHPCRSGRGRLHLCWSEMGAYFPSAHTTSGARCAANEGGSCILQGGMELRGC
jgi:hypothetical protein